MYKRQVKPGGSAGKAAAGVLQRRPEERRGDRVGSERRALAEDVAIGLADVAPRELRLPQGDDVADVGDCLLYTSRCV